MTIKDNLWGKIEIEPLYEQIINSKEFCSLKSKNQLGLNANPNAVHTRYQHSLGVYFLAEKLIKICKKKFSNILNITTEDEQAIKCMALIHDIGHGCFSHVSEKFLNGTHEYRTLNIILDEKREVHQAIINSFGPQVLKKVVDLMVLKEQIKNKENVSSTNSLMLIIKKLLAGGIDIDRLDYIYRDSNQVNGEKFDFSEILESIDIEYIDDSLEVVFDKFAEYKIANFFNKRFELYDTLYLEQETRILESIFGEFLKLTNIEITWDTTDNEMNYYFQKYQESNNEIIKRYAKILSERKLDENFIIKEINTKKVFEYFKSKLLSDFKELELCPECIILDSATCSIYNRKNKVYIKKDGIIEEINESSKILNSELKKEKHIIAIDTFILTNYLAKNGKSQEEIDKILKNIKKAMSAQIEQEKKYTFIEEINPEEVFKIIKEMLNLESVKYIENVDTYYDYQQILEKNKINLRKRDSIEEKEWVIKRPIKDQTSISKRDEKTFKTLEDALKFLQTEWNIPITQVEEVITLKTKRAKYTLKCFDGEFELVFDKTTPYLNDLAYKTSYMIECELKKGNSSGLYFINEQLNHIPYIIESNLSKKEIGLNTINNNLDVKLTRKHATVK